MADPKSRARVERLLRGDFRQDDLMGLFLYARDHCDGRECVADIGHFVAHHHERDKGIITRSTREWAATAKFHMFRIGPNAVAMKQSRLPASTPEYFETAVNRADSRLLKADTGLTRSRAFGMLSQLATRLVENSDGTWSLPGTVTPQEASLLDFVTNTMTVKPAFESSTLVSDFIATLKSNGLISKEEIRDNFAALSELVQLFAIASMHNCSIKIRTGELLRLEATCGFEPNGIHVMAPIKSAVPGLPDQAVAAAIFTSTLDPTTHCHPDLLATKRVDFELEVAPDRRLSPMR